MVPNLTQSLIKEGINIEKEHKETYMYLKKYVEKNKSLPSEWDFFAHIAMDHLKEDKDYYSKLKEAGL